MYQQQERVKQLIEDRKQNEDGLVYAQHAPVESGQQAEDTTEDERYVGESEVDGEEYAEEDPSVTTEMDSTAALALSRQFGPSRWLKKDEMSLKLAAQLSDQQVRVTSGCWFLFTDVVDCCCSMM